MSPLRFVFVLSSFQFYGGVLLVIEYANHLARRGHIVQLFTPRGTVDPNLLERLHDSVRVIESSAPRPTSRSFSALIRLLLSMACELPLAEVVVATHTPTTAAILLARIMSATQYFPKLSSTKSNIPSPKHSAWAWLYMDYPEMFKGRYVERLLLLAAPIWFDVIWTISAPLKEAVSAYTNKPIVITGSGLPNAALFSNQQRYQSVDGKKRILYVGNSKPRKGLREFLAAIAVVYQHIPTITAVIVAPEDCWPLIEQSEIVKMGGKAIIEFYPKPSDSELSRLYASTTLFVSCSWGEGLGYPPLEAMACGTPVVLTDSGGVRDYAEHEENCLMVLPKDVTAIAAAVERLLVNEELAARLSVSGLKTMERYKWETVVELVEESAYNITNMRVR